MPDPRLRILIPALIASRDDERRLSATLAGLPPSLEAVAHPVVQASWPEFDPATSPLLRTWLPHFGGLPWLPPVPPETATDVPFPDLPPAALDAPFADAPPIEERPDAPGLPVEPLFLGAPCGKWAAVRAGLAACGPAPWIAIADGDDAYDLVVLPALLWRAEEGEADLFQGARARILLDPGPEAARRALLEPVVNTLLRARLAADGAPLPDRTIDLQSGLCLARRELLDAFCAQERMDDFVAGEPPGPLPWGAYGGELHLHAFAARRGAPSRPHPVHERFGRASGLTPTDIGRQLRLSRLFAGVTGEALTAALGAAGAAGGWSREESAAARAAAAEAFPGGP